ncbi:hypothetical protein GCM10015535_50210 [Streptomyces gelaticus]|uniref:Uncharacterized protein n=1 Tax=Streptomyces gelaticus TaxID=285446 RepID=A0ABQ2W3U2_9ACTN|nr:hypothetical protein GCM10015535_50210 [Streptomyces gelaticus]
MRAPVLVHFGEVPVERTEGREGSASTITNAPHATALRNRRGFALTAECLVP